MNKSNTSQHSTNISTGFRKLCYYINMYLKVDEKEIVKKHIEEVAINMYKKEGKIDYKNLEHYFMESLLEIGYSYKKKLAEEDYNRIGTFFLELIREISEDQFEREEEIKKINYIYEDALIDSVNSNIFFKRIFNTFKISINFIIMLFLNIIWTIVGFVFWLPFLFRMTLIYSISVLQSSLIGSSYKRARRGLLMAINFYFLGYKSINNLFEKDNSFFEEGEEKEEEEKVSTKKMIFEVFITFIFWILLFYGKDIFLQLTIYIKNLL